MITKSAFLTLIFFVFISCVKDEESAMVSISMPQSLPASSVIVDNITFDPIEHIFTVSGDNLDKIETAKLGESKSSATELEILSQSASELAVKKNSAETFVVYTNKVLNLFLSTATGASVTPLTIIVSNGAITAVKLATDAVTTEKIKNLSVTAEKIADQTITMDKLAQDGAADLEVLTWSESSSQWIPMSFNALDNSEGSVNEVIRGTGLQNKGTSITNTGTISVDVGNGADKILQFDSNGKFEFINKLIINSANPNSGEILFNVDEDAAAEFKLSASSSGFSLYKGSDEIFYINNSGKLVANALKIVDYEFPNADGNSNQLLMTDGSGTVAWKSITDIPGASASTKIEVSDSLSVSEASGTWTISIDTAGTSPSPDALGNEWLTKVKVNEQGIVINKGQVVATDLPSSIPATKISLGLVDNNEFDTLNNIDTTKTIESRLIPLEAIDITKYLESTGGTMTGDLSISNNSDLTINNGSRINIENGAEIKLKSGSVISLLAADTFDGRNFLGQDDLADNSVGTNEIIDGTISNSDISTSAEIALSKLKPLTNTSEVLISNASGAIAASGISATLLSYLSGLTGNIQDQIDNGGFLGFSNAFFGGKTSDPAGGGNYNASFGKSALNNISSGNHNLAIGYLSGVTTTSGSYNTFIGSQAGINNSGSGNVFIGYNADGPGNISNRLVISNGSGTGKITGNFLTEDFEVLGNLSISTDLTVENDLSIKGNTQLEGDVTVNGIFSTSLISKNEFNALDGILTTKTIQTQINELKNDNVRIYKVTSGSSSSLSTLTCGDYTASTAYGVSGGGCICNRELTANGPQCWDIDRPDSCSWKCDCNGGILSEAYIICTK